jgi:hypothetical protein
MSIIALEDRDAKSHKKYKKAREQNMLACSSVRAL